MRALWEDLAAALANHAMSGSSVDTELAGSIQACSELANPAYLSVSILVDDKTLAGVHNLASAPGTDSSIALYTSRKSLSHKALRAGKEKLVVKRRDDAIPGSVRSTRQVDGRLCSKTTAMHLVCMAIPAASPATVSSNSDGAQPCLGAMTAGYAEELPDLDRLEECMRGLTRHLSHYLPAHMPAFLDDLASFAPLLLSHRAREVHSHGHPTVPSPSEAGVGGCTPPGADHDPDFDPSGTSAPLCTVESPSHGPEADLTEASRPDMANGAEGSGDLTAESAGASKRMFEHMNGSHASTSRSGNVPFPSRGGTHETHAGALGASHNGGGGVGRRSDGDDVVDDAGQTDDDSEVATEDSQQEGKPAAAPATAHRNFALTSSWLSKRFIDPEVEQEFRLDSATTNYLFDAGVLLLAGLVVCIVHFAPPFHLIRFSFSFVWPLGFCAAFIWFIMYKEWYVQHRDVVAAALCVASRLQALRATYICFMHIPEAHVMAGQRWMWVIPFHFALESFFLVRDSWVRVFLFTMTLSGCFAGFPVGYGNLSPQWAALRGIGHLTVLELVSIGFQRRADSIARASFKKKHSALST